MTVVLVLALGALLVAWFAPRLLDRMLHRGVEPQVMVVTWFALVASTSLSLIASIVLVLLPGHGPAHRVVSLVHHCWQALQAGSVPRLEESAGLLGVVLAVAAAVRCVVGAVRFAQHQRALHRRHLDLLRILAHGKNERYPTLWLDLPDPVAYSVAGRPSLVVASHGLRAHLPGDAVCAVLAHEEAHLRGRHHLLVGLAEAVAGALPWLPLMRSSPEFVRTAVELCADSVAVRHHGRQAVRSALLGMAAGGAPLFALGMGGRCTELRLTVLDSDRHQHGRMTRTVRSGIAGATAVALPAVVSAALLALVTLTSCPVLG